MRTTTSPLEEPESTSETGEPLVPLVDPQKEQLEELRAFRKTDEAKKLVDWVKSKYTEMDGRRSKEKMQWQVNLAMYNGNHDVAISSGTSHVEAGTLVNPQASRKNDKRTVNRIRSAVRTEMARLVSQKPSATVVPASSEDEDLFAALAGEQIFQSLVSRRKLHAEYTKSAFWLSITGNGFIKTYWDEGLYDQDSKIWGDIRYGDVCPFNLFVPDLREQEIENQPYVLEMYTKTVDWVKYFYKEEMEGIEVVATAIDQESLLSEAYLKTSDNTNRKNDSCMCYEMWVKPGGCSLLPEGGTVTIVNETIVSYSNNGLPYEHGQYPYSHIKHVPSGKFYATSVIEDLAPLQKEYNSVRTHIARTRTRMGNAQLLSAKGSVVSSKITNEIGLNIEYKPGMPPPTPLAMSQLPAYIVQEQDRILADMEDLSGQHQVSKGSAPTGVTAATAISFLQEKDDSYMAPTYSSIEAGFEKIGRISLALAAQFWDVARTVKTVGLDNAFDAEQFRGAQIANGMDLRIEAGSALPQSKAAKQAFVMDMINSGIIPPQEGLEMMEIGGAQQLMNVLKGDKRQAQRENIKMRKLLAEDILAHKDEWDANPQLDEATGEPLLAPPVITVNSYDNHEVHIETHNIFRRSQSFDYLPDEVKAEFEAHVNMHKTMKQQEMLQQMMGMVPDDGSLGEDSGSMEDEPVEEPQGEMTELPPGVEEMPSGDAMAPDEEVI